MIDAGKTRRRSPAIALVLAFALAVLALAAIAGPAAAAEQGCPENNVCTYTKQYFEGSREVLPCSDVNYHAVPTAQSARNRCGNKWAWITTTVYKCMPPGMDRPTPGTFSSVGFATNWGEAVC